MYVCKHVISFSVTMKRGHSTLPYLKEDGLDHFSLYILLTSLLIVMLNKNTLGVKKVRGQSEATCKQAGATKSFDIS